MSTNSGSNASADAIFKCSLSEQMVYYDLLPPVVRRTLAEASFNWATTPIYNYYLKGASPHQLCAAVQVSDIKRIEKERRKKTDGDAATG